MIVTAKQIAFVLVLKIYLILGGVHSIILYGKLKDVDVHIWMKKQEIHIV